MNFTFNNETELYAQIELLKTEINANKVIEDYRTSGAHDWYYRQKDYYGKHIKYSFTHSLLLMFLDCQGLVIYNAMAIIRCENDCYSYSLVVNKIE
jgi:hypothetical protein